MIPRNIRLKRVGFIDYEGRDGSKRITRDQRRVNPISVGVICGGGYDTDVVLELEVRDDGRWSLVERPYGVSGGTTRAEGRFTLT